MVGDPYIYPVADYNVSIRTRDDVTIAASGLVSRQGGRWRFILQDVRSFAFTASPWYVKETRALKNGISISAFYLKGYDRGGRAMIQAAAECVELFSRLYGPYPYRELVLAQNGYHSAMEYSTFITVTDSYIREYTPRRPQLLLFIVSHEISHQWWYGAVGSDQVTEPWLDEALAKYSEYLYFREYHPNLEKWWLRRLASVPRLRNRYIDDRLADFNNDKLAYSRVIYGMAPAFIRKLHQMMGEEDFFAFLRDYYARGKGRFVTAADFFKVLERHTDKDITPLLKEFFRHPPTFLVDDGE
jgi:aminopeptidase N